MSNALQCVFNKVSITHIVTVYRLCDGVKYCSEVKIQNMFLESSLPASH